jgi:GH15 family glucan-1,4-alpha-glucosidase
MQRSEFDLSNPLEGLRLADERSLPCPKRMEWLAAIYEQIMEKAWNVQKQQFGQCSEETDVLGSSVLIMPLVFFIQPWKCGLVIP